MEQSYKEKYEQALSKEKDMLNYKEVRREDMEYIFSELAESEQKPNGGIVREDFTQGDGWSKVNLDYLSKAQVEEIEQLVEKLNPKEVSEDEKYGWCKEYLQCEQKFEMKTAEVDIKPRGFRQGI